MSLLFWNCRGAGNRRTVREVVALTKANSPKFVFLSETRQTSVNMERLKWRLGLKGFCGVDCDGRGGGLALFWDDTLQVTVMDVCKRYIDVSVYDHDADKSWRSTFIYGEPRVENRYRMWEHLSRLKGCSDLPWVVCGDFNEAMWQHEHFSRSLRGESQMEAFRDVLIDCELVDLGFSGAPYTYDNGHRGQSNVRVRI